jgi:phosphoglycerate dehydrogenase-like enzyme
MIFINIVRGEMSPPADLLRLLDGQFLGGIALDVYDRVGRRDSR